MQNKEFFLFLRVARPALVTAQAGRTPNQRPPHPSGVQRALGGLGRGIDAAFSRVFNSAFRPGTFIASLKLLVYT